MADSSMHSNSPASSSTANTIPIFKSLGELLPKPFGGQVSSTYSHALLEQISSNETTLTAIHLNSKGITNSQVKTLCEALICNRVVEEMHLSNNKIGDDGMKSIGHMLKFNRCLREIYLDGNQIGPKGAAALASALAANTALTTLNLRNNQIGVEGAGALAASLCHNRTIIVLSLSNNSIPKHHSILKMIYKMLRSNEQYPENRSLVVGLGEELAALISKMSADMAEDLVLQAEEALRTAMVCRRKGDVIGAAEAEGMFIRICTKGSRPLDPPEMEKDDENSKNAGDDPPDASVEQQREHPVYRMYSRKQSEPDRLDEINDELKSLTYNNKNNDRGEESFEQIASMASQEETTTGSAAESTATTMNTDTIGSMPERFLDIANMEEVKGDSFHDEDAAEVSAEWIGNVYASEP